MQAQAGLARGLRAAAAIATLSTVLACSGGDMNFNTDSDWIWIPTGPSPVIEETRSVSGVRAVVLEGAGAVTIRQGTTESLLVRTHAHVMPYIETEMRAGRLALGFEAGARFQGQASTIEFHLTVVDLARAELLGAGSITASNVEADTLTLVHEGAGSIEVTDLAAARLETTRSGAGDIEVTGVVQQQSVVLGGVGSYEARDLASAVADVTIQAAGSATVRVSDRLEARIDGPGSIGYFGDPVVERTGHGTGSVERLGG